MNARTVEIATQLADEIEALAVRLDTLVADATAIHFHCARMRLDRARGGLRTTATGLRQQTGKLRSRLARAA